MQKAILLTSLALLTLPAYAGNAHVHGEGKLDVVIDKNMIAISLELPLDVAVGFERAPRTEKERAELAAAKEALGNGSLFVMTPAANCAPQAIQVTLPEFDGKNDAHADIDAAYTYHCASPAALKSIETGIFKQFKRLYRLDAQRVGPSGQGAMRLSPKQPALIW
jgi:hypothetical protein